MDYYDEYPIQWTALTSSVPISQNPMDYYDEYPSLQKAALPSSQSTPPWETTLPWEGDPEPFLPYDTDETPYATTFLFIQKYIFTIAKLMACFLVLANNSLLIFLILRFKRLQVRTNYTILNFAVVTIVYSGICTLESMIAAFEYFLDYISLLIVVRIALYLSIQLAFILAELLIIDWFIMSTFKEFSLKYQRVYYKLIIGLCYAIPLLYIVPSFLVRYHFLVVMDLFVAILLWSGIIVILIIAVTRQCKTYDQESTKFSYAATAANIYFLMWLPAASFGTVLVFFINSKSFPFLLVAIISLILGICNLVGIVAPVVITFALIRLDANFKMSYDLIFKRSVRSYQSTAEENIC